MPVGFARIAACQFAVTHRLLIICPGRIQQSSPLIHDSQVGEVNVHTQVTAQPGLYSQCFAQHLVSLLITADGQIHVACSVVANGAALEHLAAHFVVGVEQTGLHSPQMIVQTVVVQSQPAVVHPQVIQGAGFHQCVVQLFGYGQLLLVSLHGIRVSVGCLVSMAQCSQCSHLPAAVTLLAICVHEHHQRVDVSRMVVGSVQQQPLTVGVGRCRVGCLSA